MVTIYEAIVNSTHFKNRLEVLGLPAIENRDDDRIGETIEFLKIYSDIVGEAILEREGYKVSPILSSSETLMRYYEKLGEGGKVPMQEAFEYYGEDLKALKEIASVISPDPVAKALSARN